jgi:hypothetical protein
VHSHNDEIMPFSHGRQLFETANEPKRFLEIYGSHNEGFIVSDEQYQKGLSMFVTDLARR